MVLGITIQHGRRILFDVGEVSPQVGIIWFSIVSLASLDIPEIARLINMILVLIHVHVLFFLLVAEVEESRRLDPLAHFTAVYLLIRETRTWLMIPCSHESTWHRYGSSWQIGEALGVSQLLHFIRPID